MAEQKTQGIKKYILGNFRVLPADVLEYLLLGLDKQDLLTMCISSREFSDFCESKKGRGILDKAAIEFMKENAPLSEPIRSITEQANLVKRGFSSVYFVWLLYDTAHNKYIVPSIGTQFYDEFPTTPLEKEDDDEDNPRYFDTPNSPYTFSIRGLPPKKGTKIWLALNEVVDANGYTDLILSPYLTLEAATDIRNMDSEYDIFHEVRNNENIAEIENELRLGNFFHEYQVLEVTLP